MSIVGSHLTWLLIIVFQGFTSAARRPHIIFILADDLGWNDVGFHGSSQIPTPNIDALAYSGLILNNYYVSPICTPSRSALMTGKHPIHTGMQHSVLNGAEPRGLPLNEKLLPEYLKELGYRNHMVGKWHLGCYKKEYTPLYRGFESHIGYWTGHHDYNDHTAMEKSYWGLDMRKGMDVAWDLHGQYSTDVFTAAAEEIIAKHNTTQPLFLYVAHAAVHSANPYNPLPSPDEYVAKFTHIDNYNRRRFAGVLTKLDESVGKVVKALNSNNMLMDSIIVFSTDNGGPADGFNINAASNWPLRGVKHTLWEGGVRGAGFVWSASIARSQRVAHQLIHVTDWLPTLYYAAGGNIRNIENLDGLNIWSELVDNNISPRTNVLHNIDDVCGVSALTVGEWKIIKGSTYNGTWDFWYGPSGRTGTYNISEVINCPAGIALAFIKKAAVADKIKFLRRSAEILCPETSKIKDTIPCIPVKAPCLFNIRQDPCEQHNLAELFPSVLQQLEDNLIQWNKTSVPPGNLPLDPRGNPKFWNYTWTNFGDYSFSDNTII